MGFSYVKPVIKPQPHVLTLNDGHSIPFDTRVRLGVFRIGRHRAGVSAASRAGYRHIDTAAAYRYQRETGRAVADSGVPATNCTW
ncbi:hypothetical protein B1987_23535 [Mycobacterium kansasii]|uniref:hypothetical protein n=1 Tax=Mycobacterium attenuatum TaxID=2341086 RepID=UPI000A0E444F|nr:hypothetical protein [Mycobacterium attenuatum]ORB86245.1 hypothetical protein B1987_23535 [Mycobacterium kansasii]